jgi:hypothetical protein
MFPQASVGSRGLAFGVTECGCGLLARGAGQPAAPVGTYLDST